ncbi:O-antigen ligase family protein [Cetobacterium sp.]|uniref:O-antigen ligase family protein n=1 Tax=Cetobacterium sp. TaxID=2071632 RepID=UPI002FCADD75
MKKKLKYALPLLFLIITILLIPKEGYFKKEKLKLKIETLDGDWRGYLYIVPPIGYEMEDSWRDLNGTKLIEKEFKNTINESYHIVLNSGIGEIKDARIISESGKDIMIGENQKSINLSKKDLKKIYSNSIFNICTYIISIIGLGLVLFRKGIDIDKKNLGAFSLGVVFLAVAINPKWITKSSAIFLSMTFLYLLIEKKRIKLDLINIVCSLILILGMITEYFGYANYIQNYNQFQNSFIIIICMRIWNFSNENREQIKKYLYIALFISGLITAISPLVLSGVYCFTFGALMMVLVGFSIENIFKDNMTKYARCINIIGVLLGIYGAIMSSRRTVLLALMIYLTYKIAIVLLKSRKKTKIYIVVFSVIAIGIFGNIFKENKNYLENAIVSIADPQNDSSNLQRILMWRRGFYIVKENPILGIGVDNLYRESIKEKYNNIKDSREKFDKNFVHAHNEYVNQIIAKGIPGGILYLGILYFIAISLKNKKDRNFDLMLFILFGVYGMFEPYTLRGESLIFWSFMGIDLPLKSKKDKGALALTILVFLIGLYLNKRFRYYFMITGFLYLIFNFYKNWRIKNEFKK